MELTGRLTLFDEFLDGSHNGVGWLIHSFL